MNKTSADPVNVLSTLSEVLTNTNLLNSNSPDVIYELFYEENTTPNPSPKPLQHVLPAVSNQAYPTSYIFSLALGILYVLFMTLFPAEWFSGIMFMITMAAVGILNIILFALTIQGSSELNEKMKLSKCAIDNNYYGISNAEKYSIGIGMVFQIAIIIGIALCLLLKVESDMVHKILQISIYVVTTVVMIGILLSGGVYLKAYNCAIITGARRDVTMGVLILAMIINSFNYVVFGGIAVSKENVLSLLPLLFAVAIILLTITYWGSIGDDENTQKNVDKNMYIMAGIIISIIIFSMVLAFYMFR
jgi:hypothetical protein